MGLKFQTEKTCQENAKKWIVRKRHWIGETWNLNWAIIGVEKSASSFIISATWHTQKQYMYSSYQWTDSPEYWYGFSYFKMRWWTVTIYMKPFITNWEKNAQHEMLKLQGKKLHANTFYGWFFCIFIESFLSARNTLKCIFVPQLEDITSKDMRT